MKVPTQTNRSSLLHALLVRGWTVEMSYSEEWVILSVLSRKEQLNRLTNGRIANTTESETRKKAAFPSQVVRGFDILGAVEKMGSVTGHPAHDVRIIDCGICLTDSEIQDDPFEFYMANIRGTPSPYEVRQDTHPEIGIVAPNTYKQTEPPHFIECLLKQALVCTTLW